MKTTQRELINLQSFILTMIKSKIIKAFQRFDYTNTKSIARLKFYLVLRDALDKSGYRHIHDIYISKVVSVLHKNKPITFEDATSAKVINAISTLIQSKNLLKHEEISKNGSRVEAGVDFVNRNYDVYDEQRRGKVARDGVLLMLSRLGSEDVVIVYNDFEKLWSEFGYTPLTELAKEGVMTFVLTYLHHGADVKLAPRKTNAVQENNENEQVVRNLAARVTKLERTLDSTEQRTLDSAKTRAAEQRTERPLRFNDDPLKPLLTCFAGRYYPVTHMCTSEHCLLCHGKYP